MIRVSYPGETYPVCLAGSVEVWHLGGGVFVGVLAQDRVKAADGKRVRVRSLTPAERGILDHEKRLLAAQCGQEKALTPKFQDVAGDVRRVLDMTAAFLTTFAAGGSVIDPARLLRDVQTAIQRLPAA